MWKSGITFRQLSSGLQLTGCGRCSAPKPHTLRWVNGTIFGREVVPEVCSTRASVVAGLGPRPPAAGVDRTWRPVPCELETARRTLWIKLDLQYGNPEANSTSATAGDFRSGSLDHRAPCSARTIASSR